MVPRLPEPPALAVLPAWWGSEIERSGEQLERCVVEVLGELATWPTLREQRPRRLLVLRRVSRSKCGFVYAALDVPMGRVVALKLPRAPDDDREPKLLAVLAHPRVLVVYDVVHVDGYVGALLEWADTDLLSHAPERPWPWVLARLLEVGEALVHVHAHGIVHGDVKPENILICGDVAKLGDFGTARPETEFGAVSGTRMYMPPERYEGIWRVEGDVYSWCISALDLFEERDPPPPAPCWSSCPRVSLPPPSCGRRCESCSSSSPSSCPSSYPERARGRSDEAGPASAGRWSARLRRTCLFAGALTRSSARRGGHCRRPSSRFLR
ncbi:MAG: protein kinase [Deltaproteobacteria bacterium]|nr:protein kinase [Deltaproteobacteria bacterium]